MIDNYHNKSTISVGFISTRTLHRCVRPSSASAKTFARALESGVRPLGNIGNILTRIFRSLQPEPIGLNV
jgi:hypothetical protein